MNWKEAISYILTLWPTLLKSGLYLPRPHYSVGGRTLYPISCGGVHACTGIFPAPSLCFSKLIAYIYKTIQQ